MVEEINESHVTNWTEMLEKSTPQITKTPYSSYMDIYQLKKHVVAYDATKLKEVVGYKLRRPTINADTLKEIISKAQAEGTWPVLSYLGSSPRCATQHTRRQRRRVWLTARARRTAIGSHLLLLRTLF